MHRALDTRGPPVVLPLLIELVNELRLLPAEISLSIGQWGTSIILVVQEQGHSEIIHQFGQYHGADHDDMILTLYRQHQTCYIVHNIHNIVYICPQKI